jgi:hypothetical protein
MPMLKKIELNGSNTNDAIATAASLPVAYLEYA